jgi:hypothetical protein
MVVGYDVEVFKGDFPMAEQRYERLQKIIEKAGSSFVSVTFVKKDGSERQMTFNPRDWNEIKGTGSRCNDPNIFRIREVNNKEEGRTSWRSFDARRVLKACANGSEVVWDGVEV